MEPLTRLFADLVDWLKLLTPSRHSPNNGPLNYEGNGRHGHKWMGFHNGHRQNGKGNYHRQDNGQKNCSIDHHHQTSFTQNGGHHPDSRDSVDNKSKYTKRHHTRIHKIESGSECDSECSVASDFEEHLEEETSPTPVLSKTNFPPQVIENMPERLIGRPFMRKI